MAMRERHRQLTDVDSQELTVSNSRVTTFSATKILLPIDFSPSSEVALEAATGLAQQFHAGIHLVHIIPEIPDFNGSDFFPETSVLQERKATIEEKLENRRKQLIHKGVATTSSIETGNDVVGNLMRVIKRENADMLVISTHGMSGWHPLLFGSIAQQMIKQVDCTLLLLQSGHHRSTAKDPALDVWEDSFVPQSAEAGQLESTAPKSGPPMQSRLDQVAGALAEQGGRTQQQYDQAHSLFTK
jgi:nucleotide-binding universal stress UspA family protein